MALLTAVPIDRYNSVGHRKREGIHPFFNAQFPVVWQMLQHMCPFHAVEQRLSLKVERDKA
jgi:hypothetical protein